jgi:RNA recognition motif-containing protein
LIFSPSLSEQYRAIIFNLYISIGRLLLTPFLGQTLFHSQEAFVAKKLFIGNLSFDATEEAVRELLSPHGEVLSLNLITDKYTGRSRGFGFAEIENADAAMAELNGKEFMGRQLKVSEARERPPRRGGGFNRGGGRGDRSW